MSLSYQTSWKYLQAIYVYPKVFTDRCRDPGSETGVPTVICNSACVSLQEWDIEAGVFIGYKHIRGCIDSVLRHGFNQTALRTHRFHQNIPPYLPSSSQNYCRTLSRAHLFKPARSSDAPAIGDVQLCSCYGDRCNGSNSATNYSLLFILIPVILQFLIYG
uniref:Caenorhabditis elegans ly-6-related family-containing protein n=1 Tax=Heterorhabditis bacteriophora TaxID=37862 RepID=A0A1I7XLV9_HETBA